MCDIIFLLLPEQSHSPCFIKQIFNEMSTPGSQKFQSYYIEIKTSIYILRRIAESEFEVAM